MRIGFDGKRATHNFRGLGNYSRSIVEGIIEYAPTEDLFLYTPDFTDKRALNWVKLYENKIHLKKPENFVAKIFPAFWRSYCIDLRVAEDKLDIYHGLSHELPFFLQKKDTKWVVTIHDLIFLRFPQFFPFIDRQVYFQKFKRACDSADLVIAICEQTKKDLIELLHINEKKIVIHYQSCDPHFYEDSNIEHKNKVINTFHLPEKFILNVGAFEERKNQLNLVVAFAKIANVVAHDLVFVGHGKKYLKEVRTKAFQLGIANRVHFYTKVNFHDLPVFYQLADLFCFPSLFEGFGIPILEALFSKTPVITSLGSCFPESAGPNSSFVDPHSIEGLAEEMKKILGSKELQLKMQNEGLIYAQNFHRKVTTTNLLNIYHNM